jgi:hypothetical protein
MTLQEEVARDLWQDESLRATDKPRRIEWENESRGTRDKWLRTALAALTAIQRTHAIVELVPTEDGLLRLGTLPSDEHSMPHVANHADIALQDAMTGSDAGYDNAKFLASMRGNGYRITREPDTRGEANSITEGKGE